MTDGTVYRIAVSYEVEIENAFDMVCTRARFKRQPKAQPTAAVEPTDQQGIG